MYRMSTHTVHTLLYQHLNTDDGQFLGVYCFGVSQLHITEQANKLGYDSDLERVVR